MSDMGEESDNTLSEYVSVESPKGRDDQHELVVVTINLSPHRAPSGLDKSPVSLSSPDTEGPASDYSSSSSSGNDGFFVGTEDPTVIACELGESSSKFIGSNVLDALRFESEDREQLFLSKASVSFCVPLMEKELMEAGVPRVLQSAQDLALKSFIASRCTAQQIEAEASSSSRVLKLEAKIAMLEMEKSELQYAFEREDIALATVQDEANQALTLKDKYCEDLGVTQVKLSWLKPMPRRWGEKISSK